ncbi:MAG: hypothetical protein ACLQIB_37965 [Isosphaeraceae bacterium]
MAVADEIDALATRAKNDLDDLVNFGAHIHLIWKHFKVWVHQGNTLKSKNIKTGTEVTERDLLKLYPGYRTTYLQGLSFVQLTTLFEAFVFDFLRLLLTNDPRHLAQKKQIEVGVALSAADRGALVLLVAERELNELKYDRPRAWFDYMSKIVKLGCPTADEIERIAEMKAARDLLIHNSGIVNRIYLDKAGTKKRYAVGDKVVIDRPYFDECWVLAKKLVDDIAAGAKRRLSKPAAP